MSHLCDPAFQTSNIPPTPRLSCKTRMRSDHGFGALPRNPEKILEGHSKESPYVPISEITVPYTPVTRAVHEYVEKELSTETYNHSMRVYYYGQAIIPIHFPEWNYTAEAYYLSCLLHDIATTDKNLRATKMSFEYYGGFIAHDLIVKNGGSQDLAECVTEAIIRHQDFIDNGMITTLGQILQLTTILDNIGSHAQLIHPKTIEDISREFPRNKWTGCFANVVKTEIKLKPWSHTTSMGPSEDAIVSAVWGNKVMARYD